MRIGLVGCVKEKAPSPAAARELYVSTLFRGRRRHVERSCDRWFILSALHGLVDPSSMLHPYDVTLKDMPPTGRREWSRRVLDQLHQQLGDLGRYVFEIHAGSAYRENGLVAGLKHTGAVVDVPAAGLPIGRQLSLYARDARIEQQPLSTRPGRTARDVPASTEPLRSYLERASSPVTLTFAQIEEIVRRPLPASARKHRAWWANSRSQVLGRQWLAAGWRAEMVDLAHERVRLTR